MGALRWTLGPVPGVGVSFDHGGAVVPGVRSRGTKYAASGKLGIQNGTEFSVRKRIARSFTAYAETRLGLSEVGADAFCPASSSINSCRLSSSAAPNALWARVCSRTRWRSTTCVVPVSCSACVEGRVACSSR